MASDVLPVLKSIYLCDSYVGYANGKVDLYGLFSGIRPERFPHVQERFCIFAQLVNGLGETPFFFDIRQASTDRPIHTTDRNVQNFPNRTRIVQLAMTIRGCPFDEPGLYIIDLFCNNEWVADTAVRLENPT
jgi:hypothetical protein